MTGKRANIFFRLSWQIVAPVLVTVSKKILIVLLQTSFFFFYFFLLFFFFYKPVYKCCTTKARQKSLLFNATPIVDVLLQVILIFSIIEFKPARYEDYVFPPWAQGVGWIIALASIIWIPVCAVHTLWVLPGSVLQVTSVRYFPH